MKICGLLLKNLKKNGGYYWVKATVEPTFSKDGDIIGYSSIRYDITDKKKLEIISITDGLTNIYNRRFFNEIFPKIINNAKRKNELICFLFMDIDHFKLYNDNYGHQKGDDVLVSFAKCLKDKENVNKDSKSVQMLYEIDDINFKIKSFNDYTHKLQHNIPNLTDDLSNFQKVKMYITNGNLSAADINTLVSLLDDIDKSNLRNMFINEKKTSKSLLIDEPYSLWVGKYLDSLKEKVNTLEDKVKNFKNEINAKNYTIAELNNINLGNFLPNMNVETIINIDKNLIANHKKSVKKISDEFNLDANMLIDNKEKCVKLYDDYIKNTELNSDKTPYYLTYGEDFINTLNNLIYVKSNLVKMRMENVSFLTILINDLMKFFTLIVDKDPKTDQIEVLDFLKEKNIIFSKNDVLDIAVKLILDLFYVRNKFNKTLLNVIFCNDYNNIYDEIISPESKRNLEDVKAAIDLYKNDQKSENNLKCLSNYFDLFKKNISNAERPLSVDHLQ